MGHPRAIFESILTIPSATTEEVNFFTKRIDPKSAEHLLTFNHPNNRKPSDKVVQRLAKDMSEGRWRLNGEAIVFDTLGHLVNGRHRLNAVILSGVTIETAIVTGVDPDSLSTFDQHNKRSVVASANMAGIKPRARAFPTTRAFLSSGLKSYYSDTFLLEQYAEHREAIDFGIDCLIGSPKTVQKAVVCAAFARAYLHEESSLLLSLGKRLSGNSHDLDSDIPRTHTAAALLHSICSQYGQRRDCQIYGVTVSGIKSYCAGNSRSKIRALSSDPYPIKKPPRPGKKRSGQHPDRVWARGATLTEGS